MTVQSHPAECPLCKQPSPRAFYQEDARDLLLCPGCHLVFAWPMLAAVQDDSWETKYSRLGDASDTVDTHDARDGFFRAFFQTPPLAGTTGHILDVGCADGHFLTIAREAGWAPTGIDLSPSAARFAREKHDLHVIEGNLCDTSLAIGTFDLITFWDVLEHLPDPIGMLRSAHAHLTPGGRVFLRVPNLPYLMAKYRIWTRWLRHPKCFIPLVHWYNFSVQSLGHALKEAGFTTVEFRPGKPEVYGSLLRRSVQYAFGALAPLSGANSPFCFALEAFAQKDE